MSDALEAAVIAMVLQGDADVSRKAGQVTADLTSAERAGRAAEKAAKTGESAVEGLGEQVREVTHKLHLAIRVAERLASAGGVESPALRGLGEGVSTAIATQRLFAPLDAVLPGSSLVAGAAAGVFSGVSSYQKSEAEEQKKSDEQAEKIAKKIAEEQHKLADKNLAAELVRQAAASQFDNVLGARTIR